MTDEPHNLILDHLRAIRGELKALQHGQQDLKNEMISLRQEVHNLRGDSLRRDQSIAGLEVSIERIKSRLDLSDA